MPKIFFGIETEFLKVKQTCGMWGCQPFTSVDKEKILQETFCPRFLQFGQINTRDRTLFSSRYELAMSWISCFGLLLELTYFTRSFGESVLFFPEWLHCCSGQEHQPYKQLKRRKRKIIMIKNRRTGDAWELALGRDHLCKQAKNSKALPWLTSSVALHV